MDVKLALLRCWIARLELTPVGQGLIGSRPLMEAARLRLKRAKLSLVNFLIFVDPLAILINARKIMPQVRSRLRKLFVDAKVALPRC